MNKIVSSINCISKIAKINTNGNKFVRHISLSNKNNAKVVLYGAGGGIGQSLALLMKYNPLITHLTLLDVKDIKGVATDLSHIDTSTKILCPSGFDLENPLDFAEVIVIAAGLPRKPNQTRDDLFKLNAEIVLGILKKVTTLRILPKIAIITNPVNSIVPMAHTYLSQFFSESKVAQNLYGVTTLDCVRASTFYAQCLDKDPRDIVVPVVGGHSDKTMVPLFSLSNIPCLDNVLSQKLVAQVRNAGTAVVEAKAGAGSATLSMAYAANRFVNSILESYYGKMTTECAFVYSQVHSDLNFFGEIINIHGNKNNIFQPHERATTAELQMISDIIPDLVKDVNKGIELAENHLKEYKGKSKAV